MYFTGLEVEQQAVTALELLAYDDEQKIVDYLKRQPNVDGGFDISSLAGVESLSES